MIVDSQQVLWNGRVPVPPTFFMVRTRKGPQKASVLSSCVLFKHWIMIEYETRHSAGQALSCQQGSTHSASLGSTASSGPVEGGLCRGLLPCRAPQVWQGADPTIILSSQCCPPAPAALRDGHMLPTLREAQGGKEIIFPFSCWAGPVANQLRIDIYNLVNGW